jgi:hypothetical protein
VLIGTPDIVTERLRILQEEIGIDCILAELNCGGLIPPTPQGHSPMPPTSQQRRFGNSLERLAGCCLQSRLRLPRR